MKKEEIEKIVRKNFQPVNREGMGFLETNIVATVKELAEKQTNMLSADNGYSLGKFKIILDGETGELKVIVETNKDHLQIKPSSGNAVILIACR